MMSDDEPVARAEDHVGKHGVHREQRQRRRGDGHAHRGRAVEASEPPAADQKEDHPGQRQQDLLVHVVRGRGGGHGHAEGGEVEGQGLHLKAAAADDAHGVVAAPLHDGQRRKAEGDGGQVLLFGEDRVLHQQKELKQRQLQQRHGGGDPAAGRGALLLQLFPLLRADLLKTHAHAAQIDHVPVVDAQAVLTHAHAVDPDAAAGEDVVYLPDPAVVSRQDRVGPADALPVDAHVGAGRAAEDVLPVVDGEAAVASADIGPGLRLVLLAQHGADTADDDRQAQQDQRILGRSEHILQKQLGSGHSVSLLSARSRKHTKFSIP